MITFTTDFGLTDHYVGTMKGVIYSINPDARIVYVDVDPIAVAHSQAILHDVDNAVAIQGDARQPEALIDHPVVRQQLDWTRPIGVLLLALLHFVPDDAESAHIVRALREAIPSGSYLVITHATDERIDASGRQQVEQVYQRSTSPFHFRTRDQIAQLFDGFEKTSVADIVSADDKTVPSSKIQASKLR